MQLLARHHVYAATSRDSLKEYVANSLKRPSYFNS